MSADALTAPIVRTTARFSLGAQVFFTLITAATVVLPLSDEHAALLPIAILETVSQVIEFVYYSVVLCYYKKILTWTRYLDWVISTPVMLVSTMAFLMYLEDGDTTLVDVFSSDRIYFTMGVLLFNWLMLLFGLVVERECTQQPFLFLALGTVAFIASFATLLIGFVRGTTGAVLVLFMYIVWGLYGIAATQPNVPKNVAYNLLDIVSKNFYGVFLFVYGLVTIAER